MTRFLRYLVLGATIAGAQLPPNPQINPLGRQNPYISTEDVRITNTITTVYEVTYLRTIRVFVDATNTIYKTNFLPMGESNIVSRTETNSPAPK